jgi:hypothetical protein
MLRAVALRLYVQAHRRSRAAPGASTEEDSRTWAAVPTARPPGQPPSPNWAYLPRSRVGTPSSNYGSGIEGITCGSVSGVITTCGTIVPFTSCVSLVVTTVSPLRVSSAELPVM